MRYYYRVELTRKVSEPLYGPKTYWASSKREVFPFGKNEKLKTGKEAKKEAMAYAESMMEHSSIVSIFRMNGCNGLGEYLKQDHDSRFTTGWDDFDKENNEQKSAGSVAESV